MSAIFPSGKRKIVHAQGMDAYGDLENDSMLSPSTPGQEPQAPAQDFNSKDPKSMFNNDPNSFDLSQNIKEDQPEQDSDVLDYIMKKLESWGYPPRRLNEFKDEFVNEKLLPGQARDVAVTFPDMYYGKAQRLPREEISKITEEIQSNFGLTFKDGERKDKKVFLNFVSHNPDEEGKGEDAGMGDALDAAFGGGGASQQKSKQKKRVAQTQSEMMKSAMHKAFERINNERQI